MKRFFLAFVLLACGVSAFAQNYTIQQYLNIKSASSPTLSPDAESQEVV